MGLLGAGVARASRSLAAFACVELAAGESTVVELLDESSELAGDVVPVAINSETTLGELMADPMGGVIMAQFADDALAGLTGGSGSDEASAMMRSMLGSMPIGRVVNFPGSPMT